MDVDDLDDQAGRLDVGGYVARTRRLADLSQRELADLVRVSASTVARWESGAIPMRVEDLAKVLHVAGLSVQVVDGEGAVVPPFDPDSVRDNAGRRFPAHLDVLPPDQRPDNRGYGARYDRKPPRGWYALRPLRDHERECGEHPAAAGRPVDHPTEAELARRATDRRAEALRRARQRVRPRPQPDCTCPVGCFEVAGCLPTCPCRCEPVARAAPVPASGVTESPP